MSVLWPTTVLYVEDEPADVELTRAAMRRSRIVVDLDVVTTGMDALARLRREPPYEGTRRPDLVLLDLNLPGLDGREVLAEMKQDPDLRRIPVAILTTSNAEEDVIRSYDLGANCYLIKPMGMDQWSHAVATLHDFWFSIVTLPSR